MLLTNGGSAIVQSETQASKASAPISVRCFGRVIAPRLDSVRILALALFSLACVKGQWQLIAGIAQRPYDL